MKKLIKFNNFSDSIFSLSKFNIDKNETNSKEYKKLLKILKKIIDNELTEKQKVCLTMYYRKNMNTVKISDQLGVYPSTVWRHIQKSKKRIERIIKYYC